MRPLRLLLHRFFVSAPLTAIDPRCHDLPSSHAHPAHPAPISTACRSVPLGTSRLGRRAYVPLRHVSAQLTTTPCLRAISRKPWLVLLLSVVPVRLSLPHSFTCFALTAHKLSIRPASRCQHRRRGLNDVSASLHAARLLACERCRSEGSYPQTRSPSLSPSRGSAVGAALCQEHCTPCPFPCAQPSSPLHFRDRRLCTFGPPQKPLFALPVAPRTHHTTWLSRIEVVSPSHLKVFFSFFTF